jgi:hypothetical protein
MRVNGFAASIVLASLALLACEKEAAPLVGRWEPVEQFDSGFAGVVDFGEDGTVSSGMVVQVSFPYSIDGSALVFPSVDGVPRSRGSRRATPTGGWASSPWTRSTCGSAS